MRERVCQHGAAARFRDMRGRILLGAEAMGARLAFAAAMLLAVLGSGCSRGTPWQWNLPPGFPEPRVPADNPLTQEKVALGRKLFYDERLSANGTQSCAS